MRVIKLTIYSLVIFALLVPASYASETGIEVTGTAKETVVPDIATFSFSISGKGLELEPLKADIDKKTASTVTLCKKLGIKSKHITSSEISIHPQYNYQTRSFIGYDVSRNITVVLYDLENYTALVNGAIKAGITTINNISLDTKDRNTVERKALVSAIHAAKQKAETIASSSGVKLGKVLYVKEGGGSIRLETYNFRQDRVSGVAQGAFEPGEITVTSSVSIRYAIK